MKIGERLAKLEGELIADADDLQPVVVRVRDGSRDGRGLLPDHEITGLRATLGGRLTQRRPGESVADLVSRAAAAEPERHPLSRPIFLALYRPDSTRKIRTP